jgi:4'-phosphopantetheinyl transferase
MSLVSQLLKHWVASQVCGVPWENTSISKDANGKPIYVSPDGGRNISFNVSHQAGLVPLVATSNTDLDVGVDVVCVNERQDADMEHIRRNGLFSFIDMHADVFHPEEIGFLKHDVDDLVWFGQFDPSPTVEDYMSKVQFPFPAEAIESAITVRELLANDITEAKIVEAKLRRFYALWCIREAYVKMTGEALLAPWLQQFRILPFQVPWPEFDASILPNGDNYSLVKGDVFYGVRATLNGERLNNVSFDVRALGHHYIIATCVRDNSSQEGTDLLSLYSNQEYEILSISNVTKDAKPWP